MMASKEEGDEERQEKAEGKGLVEDLYWPLQSPAFQEAPTCTNDLGRKLPGVPSDQYHIISLSADEL